MGMALKRDVQAAQLKDGNARPVDLVHLSTQTFGDDALLAEIAGMFVKQSQTYIEGASDADDEVASRACHSLKGAARAIGAFRLAEIAEAGEKAVSRDVNALKAEMKQVCGYLASLHPDRH